MRRVRQSGKAWAAGKERFWVLPSAVERELRSVVRPMATAAAMGTVKEMAIAEEMAIAAKETGDFAIMAKGMAAGIAMVAATEVS